MKSIISRAPPPISSTASYAEDVVCFILEKLEELSGQGLVSIGVQSLAMMLSGVTNKGSDKADSRPPKPKGAPGQNVEQQTFAQESSA
jgi:hypothetical protein